MPPAEALKQAATKMADAKSARFTADGTMRNKQYAKRALAFNAKGQTRFGGKKAWLWWDLTNVFPVVIASEAPRGQRDIYRALFDDPHGWRMELRVRGNDTWISLPALTDLFGGKPWIKSKGSSGQLPDQALDEDLGFAWLDPGAMVSYLAAADRVEEIGVEDGLTHYRARVPLRRLVAQAPRKERAALRRAIREVRAQTGKRAFPLEVWLGADGLPRRFSVTEYQPKDENERYPTTWRATVEILEYGVDFDVLRPSARMVMTEREFDRLTGS